MANLEHPSFRQPTNSNIWLWRYMDLSKFAALLQKRSLIFCRADLLGDSFEGSVPLTNARKADYIRFIREIDPDKNPHPDMTDEQIEIMFQGLESIRRSAIKVHFINCWHMNEAESAGMWKLYSSSNDAVCIRTSYRALADELPADCYMGLIDYIDFKTAVIPSDNLFAPFLVKRQSFSHEREARVIWVDYDMLDNFNPPAIKEISINLERVVHQIYISPSAPAWFRDVVQDLCAKYGLYLIVDQSEIGSIPIY